MDKIPFEDGTKTQEAYVTINRQNYIVTPEVWNGNTPLSAFNLNKMQDNIDNAKADKSDLNTLSTKVDNKADKSDLDTLSTKVDSKADESDLDTLSIKVDNKADKTVVENGLATAILRAGMSQQMTISGSQDRKEVLMPFDIERYKMGELSLSNNKIIIGKNINTILVNVQLYFYTTVDLSTSKIITIRRNESDQGTISSRMRTCFKTNGRKRLCYHDCN